ncbi:MAG: polysaccharide biosynthesis protein [Chloroflexota bacterium]|nr:polysaccharide biosynthesis protein [Chloroflexota bacterium]
MKYFIDTITALHAPKETPKNHGIAQLLQERCLALLPYGVVALLLFNIVIALQFLSRVYTLVLSCVLGACLLFLLMLQRVESASSRVRARKHLEIDVADLLERGVVPLETSEARSALKGRVILVSGAAGSIGMELCRQLLDYEPALLIALDMNETGLFDLVEGLRSRAHPQIAHLYPFIGDITDMQRMTRLFAEKSPDIVFHAAAYKHVPMLEEYPDLAIRTNVLGTYRLCCLAQEYGVARFVFISTDKATEPVSVLGATKRVGEMIVEALAKSTQSPTRFCSVRFGNVIGSRGSVVPIFTQQIEQGGPLTVTDPEATRYFMTIPEACELVILTSVIAEQGGLYLLNMGHPVRILDLALKMIRLSGLREGRDIGVVYTGLRPGERLHETLIAVDEELIPTANSKILGVMNKRSMPTLATIIQWMGSLEVSLQQEDVVQQRAHLFEIVRDRKLLSASIN